MTNLRNKIRSSCKKDVHLNAIQQLDGINERFKGGWPCVSAPAYKGSKSWREGDRDMSLIYWPHFRLTQTASKGLHKTVPPHLPPPHQESSARRGKKEKGYEVCRRVQSRKQRREMRKQYLKRKRR